MFKTTKKSIQWGEETLTLETGKIARQADGCVIATYGETSVMAAVTFVDCNFNNGPWYANSTAGILLLFSTNLFPIK